MPFTLKYFGVHSLEQKIFFNRTMIYFIKMIKLNTDTTSYNIFIFSSYSSSINYLNHICFMSTLCWFQGHQLHLVFMSLSASFNLEELLQIFCMFLEHDNFEKFRPGLFVCLFVFLQNDLTQMLSSLLIYLFQVTLFVRFHKPICVFLF